MRVSLGSIFSAGTTALLIVGVCSASAKSAESAIVAPSSRLAANVELEGRIRSEGADGNARLAIPVWRVIEHHTLLQASAFKGEESLGGISAGVIRRFRPSGGDWVFGLNAFYEAKETPDSFDLQQLVLGAEIARSNHILRANAWLPLTGGEKRKVSGGDTLAIAPTRGFDAEYEVDLPSPIPGLQPRAALGYYYLQARGAGVEKTVSGFKARTEVQYRYVTLGVEWREDERAFGGNWMGMLRVELPLGRTPATALSTSEARMSAPIRRDTWPMTLRSTEGAPGRHFEDEPARFQASPLRAPSSVANDPNCCGGAPDELIFE